MARFSTLRRGHAHKLHKKTTFFEVVLGLLSGIIYKQMEKEEDPANTITSNKETWKSSFERIDTWAGLFESRLTLTQD